MKPNLEQSIESWTDDELLEQYRQSMTADDLTDTDDVAGRDISVITEEMRRRNLSFPGPQPATPAPAPPEPGEGSSDRRVGLSPSPIREER